MSGEWEFLTAYQCFHVPNHCSVLNISVMYKVNSEISHNVLLVFYVIETKNLMAEFKKVCRQSEWPTHNKLYWFGWDVSNLLCNNKSIEFTKFNNLTNNSRFHWHEIRHLYQILKYLQNNSFNSVSSVPVFSMEYFFICHWGPLLNTKYILDRVETVV